MSRRALQQQIARLQEDVAGVGEAVGWGVVRLDQVEQSVLALRSETATAEPHARQAYLDTQALTELSFGLERLTAELTGRLADAAALLHEVQRALESAGVDQAIEAREHRDRLEHVDLPFAYAAAAGIERGATVTSIGEDAGLRQGLGSLGLRVTALGDDDSPLDAVFCLATLPEVHRADVDDVPPTPRESLSLLAARLVPDGELILTLPFGRAHGAVDRATLDRLVEGWETRERVFAHCRADGWEREECTWPPETAEPRVVLLRLTPAP